jgi:hypothetical protein
MMQTTAMIDHFDGADYNLRLLIERMQQMRSSEREIEVAVREASGCLSHPAGPRWTVRRRPPFRVVGRRLQGRGRLSNREEG